MTDECVRCGCGDEIIWGSEADDADRAAWSASHASCPSAPRDDGPSSAMVRLCAEVAEAVRSLRARVEMSASCRGIRVEVDAGELPAARAALAMALGLRCTVGAVDGCLLIAPRRMCGRRR